MIAQNYITNYPFNIYLRVCIHVIIYLFMVEHFGAPYHCSHLQGSWAPLCSLSIMNGLLNGTKPLIRIQIRTLLSIVKQ